MNVYQIYNLINTMDLSPVNCPKVPADFHLRIREKFVK